MDVKKRKNFYEVLSVPLDASVEEIKIVYRELARLHHPDAVRTSENPGAAPDRSYFQEIAEAYSTLSNAERRAEYDIFLRENLGDYNEHWFSDKLKREEAVRPRPAPVIPLRSSETMRAPKVSEATAGWSKKPSRSAPVSERLRFMLIIFSGVLFGMISALLVFLLIKAIL